MKRLASLFVLLLSGCGWVPGTDANLIGRAEAAIRYQARDGTSLQFRNERVLRGGFRMMDEKTGNFMDVGPLVCGEVNGKNSFGAFDGFRPFVYDATLKTVSIRPEAPVDIETAKAVLNFPDQCLSPKDARP